MSCTCVLSYCRRHYANGTCTRNKNVLAKNGECKRGVRCVAERIENCVHFLGNILFALPKVGKRNRRVLCKNSLNINADTASVGAQMSMTLHAVAAMSANDMTLAAYKVAHLEYRAFTLDFYDFAHELMTDNHRSLYGVLRPLVPFVNVNVRAANSGFVNFNECLTLFDYGDFRLLKPKSFFSMSLYECVHFHSYVTSTWLNLISLTHIIIFCATVVNK